jgi:hypothetical protein
MQISFQLNQKTLKYKYLMRNSNSNIPVHFTDNIQTDDAVGRIFGNKSIFVLTHLLPISINPQFTNVLLRQIPFYLCPTTVRGPIANGSEIVKEPKHQYKAKKKERVANKRLAPAQAG